jgi:hypothetical protein
MRINVAEASSWSNRRISQCHVSACATLLTASTQERLQGHLAHMAHSRLEVAGCAQPHALPEDEWHTWSTARLSLTSFRCGHAGMPFRRHTRLSVDAHTPSRCAASPRLRRKCACAHETTSHIYSTPKVGLPQPAKIPNARDTRRYDTEVDGQALCTSRQPAGSASPHPQSSDMLKT